MVARPPIISIALLSGAALSFEILLMHLFSIILYHHFAYLIISLALLGYGVSGTFISICQNRLTYRYTTFFICFICSFGISTTGSFLIAQYYPFHPEEILWDRGQIVQLFVVFLALSIPFFFAACAICLSFIHYKKDISLIYGFDLVGAGLGSLVIIAVLFFLFPQKVLNLITFGALAIAVIASWELGVMQKKTLISALLFAIFLAGFLLPSINLYPSPYKSMQQYKHIRGSKILAERSSPLGLVSIMENKSVPFRHVPGLSLNVAVEPLPQLALFTNSDNITVLTGEHDHKDQLSYLDYITSALPYHLSRLEKVLILGSGGGSDILQARYHGVNLITAVELNPQVVDFVQNKYAEFTGKPYDNTHLHIDEIRGFIEKTNEHYDLILLSLIDAFNASGAGLYGLSENYIYTVESLNEYISHLTTNGYLAISRWVKNPPRDSLKLFATILAAMRNMQFEAPERHLVLIRSWQTSTLLVKKSPFSWQELQIVEQFCNNRSFDLAYTPSMEVGQANRYNILRAPYFYNGTKTLLSNEAQKFIKNYKFNIAPATDDRPFFHHFFKWSSFAEITSLHRQGGVVLLESAYLALIASLVVASVLSCLLIVLPLWWFRKGAITTIYSVKKTRVFIYFSAIGMAFMFIEISFIQRFVQFLHHPIYSISVSLCSFLVFAGLGSYWVQRKKSNHPLRTYLFFSVATIVLVSIIYIFFLKTFFVFFKEAPLIVKTILAALLIGPLAFPMGMPMPLALASISKHGEELIPWAWGINGCLSVISAVLATLCAIHFGFTIVIFIALLLYISVCFFFPSHSLAQTRY